MASTGPYASLLLALDKQPCRLSITQCFMYKPGPTCVNFVHATNAANHYATPQMTMWHYCIRQLLLQQSIDISCLPGTQQQTCSSGREWPMGQTDRQTADSCIDSTLHSMWAVKTAEKLKSKKTGMLRSIGKQSGKSVELGLKKKRKAMVRRICSNGSKPGMDEHTHTPV